MKNQTDPLIQEMKEKRITECERYVKMFSHYTKQELIERLNRLNKNVTEYEKEYNRTPGIANIMRAAINQLMKKFD